MRQGDPLSPILFNFVADGLTRMILKAQSNSLLSGQIDHIVPVGLKIKFHKSEIITVNDEQNWAGAYADMFNCQVGSFPIKYLGVPISPSRLHVRDWSPMVMSSAKRLDIWQGSCLSIAGRTALINSSLNNAPIYHMSLYLIHKTTLNELDKIRRKFFLAGRQC